MRIHGNPYPVFPVAPPAARAEASRLEAPAPPRVTALPAAPPRAETPVASAPHGLLELLTPEEHAFFARQAALGPLTYRPGRAAPDPAPAPLGQRIDVTG